VTLFRSNGYRRSESAWAAHVGGVDRLPLALGGRDVGSRSERGYPMTPPTPGAPRPRFAATMPLTTTIDANTSQPTITVTAV